MKRALINFSLTMMLLIGHDGITLIEEEENHLQGEGRLIG